MAGACLGAALCAGVLAAASIIGAAAANAAAAVLRLPYPCLLRNSSPFQACTVLLHTNLLSLHLLAQVYGVLLFSQGRQAEAREVLRQGVSYNPSNPQLCMEWALAEEAAGNLGALLPFDCFSVVALLLLLPPTCSPLFVAAACCCAALPQTSAAPFNPPNLQRTRCRFSSRAHRRRRSRTRRCCKPGPHWRAAWGVMSWQLMWSSSWRHSCTPASRRDCFVRASSAHAGASPLHAR